MSDLEAIDELITASRTLYERKLVHAAGGNTSVRDGDSIWISQTGAELGKLTKDIWCDMFRHDLNNYLASLGEKAPIKNLLEVYNKSLFATPSKKRIYRALEVPLQQEPACKDIYTEPKNIAFREAVIKAMADQNVDFIIYPTWSNPPRIIGDLKSPAGDNSQLIPPHTGMPGVSAPMGFTHKNLPAGLQIVGRLFRESDLIRVAYAYEQATQHRRPPDGFESLPF